VAERGKFKQDNMERARELGIIFYDFYDWKKHGPFSILVFILNKNINATRQSGPMFHELK
jgi:hypothetical protein